MMKNIKSTLLFGMTVYGFMLCPLFVSCTDDDGDLGIISEPEPEYTLPQGGNAEADKRIMELFERYGTCFIYDFNPDDAKWSMVAGTGGGSMGMSTVTPAKVDYVVKQLDWIEECFFRHYPDEFLKKNLPFKVFLASTIITDYGYDWWPAFEEPNGYTGNSFVFGYGYEKLDEMTTADKYDYFDRVNRDFLLYVYGITPPDEFASVSDYDLSLETSYDSYTEEECRYQYVYKPTEAMLAEGFLDPNAVGWGRNFGLSNDCESYINNMRYFSKDSEQWVYYLSFPKVKTKYEALRSYCINTLGFDPTAFGDVVFD